VAELPLTMQVKLLRAIQEKRVRKVGATAEEAVDVRVICATHQDLKALGRARQRFRQDLFYRLNVIELRMPALRECRDDIPMLARHILERLARAAGCCLRRCRSSAQSVAGVTLSRATCANWRMCWSGRWH
jgi:two-component system response regulator PilR (NtrC family)